MSEGRESCADMSEVRKNVQRVLDGELLFYEVGVDDENLGDLWVQVLLMLKNIPRGDKIDAEYDPREGSRSCITFTRKSG